MLEVKLHDSSKIKHISITPYLSIPAMIDNELFRQEQNTFSVDYLELEKAKAEQGLETEREGGRYNV